MACALRNWWLSVWRARWNENRRSARRGLRGSDRSARQTSRSAQAKRSAMFARKGITSANFAPRVRSPYRIIIAFAGLNNLHFIFRG
jgi:hypothetical protein